MKQEGGKGNFGTLKRAFRLLVDDVDDKIPTDIAYVFSGYAPLTVRPLCIPFWLHASMQRWHHLPVAPASM